MAHKWDSFLRTNLRGKYVQADAARMDAMNVITHYKDLSPSMEKFTFNDGTNKMLLCLKGTIPVLYRGTTYNIPVAIWLQEAHPQVSPFCYVKPTNTMQVRQGRHVDANGRVYLPYLTDWRQGSHNLVGCVQVMCHVFGEEPPVYSKPAPVRPPPQPHTPYSTQHGAPYPTYPAQGPPTTTYQPAFPSQTPYPTVNPQRPPYPTPMRAGYPPYGGYPPVPPDTRSVAPASAYPPQPSQVNAQVQKESTIDENMIKASLMTAVNDKLKRRFKDTVAQAQSEIQALKKTENDLKAGTVKIDSIVDRLEKEVADADSNIIMLEQKNEEFEKELDKLQKKQDDLDVDDVVMATTPVYRQIVSSFAEEQALEDTIYYLGEALHKGVVDVDTFLKHVRAMSRQQFMLRAVIQKARKSAGLADVY